MSFFLSQLEGKERSAECARNEKQMAEAEAADLAEDKGKAQRRNAVNDAYAFDLHIQFQGYIGGLPR